MNLYQIKFPVSICSSGSGRSLTLALSVRKFTNFDCEDHLWPLTDKNPVFHNINVLSGLASSVTPMVDAHQQPLMARSGHHCSHWGLGNTLECGQILWGKLLKWQLIMCIWSHELVNLYNEELTASNLSHSVLKQLKTEHLLKHYL